MIKFKYLFFSLASVVFILIITFFVVNYVKAETIVSATGSAQALNSGRYLYFTGYNANVRGNLLDITKIGIDTENSCAIMGTYAEFRQKIGQKRNFC